MTPDIKLRNVKLDDATGAVAIIRRFTQEYPERTGFRNGVVYSSSQHKPSFYVYRTSKTIVCVGHYVEGDGA